MAIIPSLVRKGVVDDGVGEYGYVIVDECHYLSAQSFERVARQAKARYATGLSATVARQDGHHPIIFMQCGPVRHRLNAKAQAASTPFEHFVIVQPTIFQPVRAPAFDKRVEFQMLYQELVADDHRNGRICEEVIEAVRARRSGTSRRQDRRLRRSLFFVWTLMGLGVTAMFSVIVSVRGQVESATGGVQ